MTALRKVLESIEKGLETLTQRTKDMQTLLDNLEDVLGAEGPKARPKPTAKKKATRGRPPKKAKATKAKVKKAPRKGTAIDAVYSMISRSRSGVSTAQIKKKTGFGDRKIWGIVNRLKKENKIKAAKRGLYVKA